MSAMAANRNSRYYSQSYEAVDNPAQPYVSRPESSTFQDYQDYQGYKTVSDLDISEPEPLPPRKQNAGWTRRKIFIIAGAVAACVVIGLAVGLGVGLSQRNKDKPYTYTPVKGDLKVTNEAAFGNGATHEDPSNEDDGIGAGKDEYTYYSGNASNFPDPKDWVSFGDMWAGNIHFFRTSCSANDHGSDQTYVSAVSYDFVNTTNTVTQ